MSVGFIQFPADRDGAIRHHLFIYMSGQSIRDKRRIRGNKFLRGAETSVDEGVETPLKEEKVEEKEKQKVKK